MRSSRSTTPAEALPLRWWACLPPSNRHGSLRCSIERSATHRGAHAALCGVRNCRRAAVAVDRNHPRPHAALRDMSSRISVGHLTPCSSEGFWSARRRLHMRHGSTALPPMHTRVGSSLGEDGHDSARSTHAEATPRGPAAREASFPPIAKPRGWHEGQAALGSPACHPTLTASSVRTRRSVER